MRILMISARFSASLSLLLYCLRGGSYARQAHHEDTENIEA